MNIFRNIFLSVFMLSSFIGVQAQENLHDNFSHIVVRGQTLMSISRMYGVAINDIIALNPGSDKQIRVGEVLRIPQQSTSPDGGVRRLHFHTIQPGETLYRLTQKYQVDASYICNANPGLSAQNFRSGQVIIIPLSEQKKVEEIPNGTKKQKTTSSPCREMHKVKRKEPIFSISSEYGISEKALIDANPELKTEKLKKGKFLCIPYPIKEVKKEGTKRPARIPSNEELINQNRKETEHLNKIKAALLLPFQLDATSGQQKLMIEYYEGFLLAVDSLKSQGINIDLHVFDTGGKNSSIAPLLSQPELKGMDIIFGPGHAEHVKPLSEFAKANNIRLVVPFTSKDDEVFNNPGMYQINTPQSYLYAQVFKLFADHFRNYNIVFVEVGEDEKTDYIKGLKQELDAQNIVYKSIPMPEVVENEEGEPTVPGVTTALDSLRHNIIVPTSGSNVALVKLMPLLQFVLRSENNPYTLHMFGYPEWQKYYNDHLQAFYELDTYFYSSFYTNNLLKASKDFHNNYRRWYNKEMANTYPKYGMLGFDTGFWFLKALNQYGSKLEENVNEFDIVPVQTGFHFERVNNWGGFINKKVFFIHMTSNHELIKLDFEQ